jgi:quinol monooxygenase YgiN
MIVVLGRVRTDAGRRETLVAIGQRLAAASRGEAGCSGYRLYQDTEDPDAFVFVEEWDGDEALQEHFRTPHIAEFIQAIPAALVAPPEVSFHEVAATRDLSDVSGN